LVHWPTPPPQRGAFQREDGPARLRQSLGSWHSIGDRPAWKAWCVTWALSEPMLSSPVPDPDLRRGWAAESKLHGFRALVSVDRTAGPVARRERGPRRCHAGPMTFLRMCP
jgi:hypothetical protein